MRPEMILWKFRPRLPWLCGCHDTTVFGHRLPCVWWEAEARS
jgi:hypothetical protein